MMTGRTLRMRDQHVRKEGNIEAGHGHGSADEGRTWLIGLAEQQQQISLADQRTEPHTQLHGWLPRLSPLDTACSPCWLCLV